MSTRVIAVISQKGGSGKSTVSINLASAAHKRGFKVAIADTDHQQSIYRWYKHRYKTKPLPAVKPISGAAIGEFIATSNRVGVDLLIIDTAPNSDHESKEIAKHADLILIPTGASYMDIAALKQTYDIVRATQVPALAVLNKTPPRGPRIAQAKQALSDPKGYRFQVADIQIGDRVATQNAYAARKTVHELEPDGLSAAEFDALFREICQHPVIDFAITPAQKRQHTKAATKAEKATANV